MSGDSVQPARCSLSVVLHHVVCDGPTAHTVFSEHGQFGTGMLPRESSSPAQDVSSVLEAEWRESVSMVPKMEGFAPPLGSRVRYRWSFRSARGACTHFLFAFCPRKPRFDARLRLCVVSIVLCFQFVWCSRFVLRSRDYRGCISHAHVRHSVAT